MYQVKLAHQVDFCSWRRYSRFLLQEKIPPQDISWSIDACGESSLTGGDGAVVDAHVAQAHEKVPIQVFQALGRAIQSANPDRFGLMYQAMYRLFCLSQPFDHSLLKPDIQDVVEETKAFRDEFIARLSFLKEENFFVMRNYLLEANAHFCVASHPGEMLIQAPYRRIYWDGQELYFAQGAGSDGAGKPTKWQKKGEPPWLQLPVSQLPPSLADVSHASSLNVLHAESMDCHACDLWERAQRTVFGEGAPSARVMFIGEQPGDQEDREGRPFVGPAGKIFDEALEESGLHREKIYVTNAVKHFRFIYRNDRRLHQKPDPIHIERCRVWLEAEYAQIRPQLIVLMGGTAAQSVLHRRVGVLRERSHFFSLAKGVTAFITVHPSYVLRQPSEHDKERAYLDFKRDLKQVAQFLKANPPSQEN